MSTDRFGLDQLDPGNPTGALTQSADRYGWSDRAVIDAVLAALETHQHGTGHTRLGDPAEAPDLTLGTDGILPGGLPFAYGYTLVDRYGLQTAVSPIEQVVTPAPMESPGPPMLTATTPGALPSGTYYYGLTYLGAGGTNETPMRAFNVVTLLAGDGAAEVTLADEDIPVEATHWSVWRRSPGRAFFTRIGSVSVSSPSFVDAGAIPDDDCACEPEQQPPAFDVAGATNSVTIALPAAVVAVLEDPDSGVQAWRLYRSGAPGAWPADSLIAELRDVGAGIPTSYVDEGQVASYGSPPDRSQTLQPASAILPRVLDDLAAGGATGEQATYQGWPFIRRAGVWTALTLSLPTVTGETAPDGAAAVTSDGVFRREAGVWVPVASGGGPTSLWDAIAATSPTDWWKLDGGNLTNEVSGPLGDFTSTGTPAAGVTMFGHSSTATPPFADLIQTAGGLDGVYTSGSATFVVAYHVDPSLSTGNGLTASYNEDTKAGSTEDLTTFWAGLGNIEPAISGLPVPATATSVLLVVRYDGTTLTVWSSLSTEPFSAAVAGPLTWGSPNALTLGDSAGAPYYNEGLSISNFALWDSALSDVQVESILTAAGW